MEGIKIPENVFPLTTLNNILYNFVMFTFNTHFRKFVCQGIHLEGPKGMNVHHVMADSLTSGGIIAEVPPQMVDKSLKEN